MNKISKIILGIVAVLVIAYALLSFNTYQTDDAYIASLIQEIESKIAQRDSLNTEVSKVPVAWHLDHMLKAINGIYSTLEASDPKTFQSDFNTRRLIVLGTGIMPRGKDKAPNGSIPPEVILTDDLLTQLAAARENSVEIDQLDENSYFEHPYFGNLNRPFAKRLIQVHTNHHLKIVRDILGE